MTRAPSVCPAVHVECRFALPRAATYGARIQTPLQSAPADPLWPKASSVQLRAASGETSVDAKQVEKFVAAVKTSTWLSWWAQVILSVVSAVTLFFANAVKGAAQVSRVERHIPAYSCYC